MSCKGHFFDDPSLLFFPLFEKSGIPNGMLFCQRHGFAKKDALFHQKIDTFRYQIRPPNILYNDFGCFLGISIDEFEVFGLEFDRLLIYELITHPTNREEILRVFRVLLKVFAEGEDEIIDGAGRRIDIISPYRLQDLLPGDDFAPAVD